MFTSVMFFNVLENEIGQIYEAFIILRPIDPIHIFCFVFFLGKNEIYRCVC